MNWFKHDDPEEEKRVFGQSTKPGESVMDKQDMHETTEVDPKALEKDGIKPHNASTYEKAEVDLEVLEEDAPELHREPQQAEEKFVIYMPRKDFGARINQTEFQFRAGVRTRVTRDVLNMLLEDENRGYQIEG